MLKFSFNVLELEPIRFKLPPGSFFIAEGKNKRKAAKKQLMLYVKVNDEDYPHSMNDYKIIVNTDNMPEDVEVFVIDL